MDDARSGTGPLKLSICITTLNRASYIGETLESILSQISHACEVVVVDGASTDNTEQVLERYSHRFGNLRYFVQKENNGLDRDYDRAVELAQGEFCWLFPDDDLMKPGAIACVLAALRPDMSLAIVNAESRDFDMTKSEVLHRRWLNLNSNRVYGSDEMDRLFLEVGKVLKYIGCFVIKRDVWLERERNRYLGSLYNYLYVIFQRPLPGTTIVLSEPLILYRWGNTHAWSSKVFETRVINFPSIIWSLEISDEAKVRLCAAEPWKSAAELLYLRALACYSISQYRRWIRPRVRNAREAIMPILVALCPGVIANSMFIIYYSRTRRLFQGVWEPEVLLQFMRQSPYYLLNWRWDSGER